MCAGAVSSSISSFDGRERQDEMTSDDWLSGLDLCRLDGGRGKGLRRAREDMEKGMKTSSG